MTVTSVQELFEQRIPAKLRARPDVAEKIGAIFQFEVSGPGGGSWYVDLSQPGGAVVAGTSDDAKCAVAVKDVDLLAIVNGTLSAGMAFMTGKIKVKGDYGLAMKLSQVL